jgi:hypothetical protein
MNYLKAAVGSIVVTLLAMILAPVLPAFASPTLGPCDNSHATRVEPRLPTWLAWFMTPDNSLYGDIGWRTEHCKHWHAYWGQVQWLWRNPAYGFDKAVAAAHIAPDATLEYSGDPYISNAANGIREGFCRVRITNPDGSQFWNYNRVKRVGNRVLKLNFGWKLKTYAEVPARIVSDPTAPVVTSVKLSRIA